MAKERATAKARARVTQNEHEHERKRERVPEQKNEGARARQSARDKQTLISEDAQIQCYRRLYTYISTSGRIRMHSQMTIYDIFGPKYI